MSDDFDYWAPEVALIANLLAEQPGEAKKWVAVYVVAADNCPVGNVYRLADSRYVVMFATTHRVPQSAAGHPKQVRVHGGLVLDGSLPQWLELRCTHGVGGFTDLDRLADAVATRQADGATVQLPVRAVL